MRDIYAYVYQLIMRTRRRFFSSERVSVFKPCSCLLRVASGASNFAWRETKDQSYSYGKKMFFVKIQIIFLYSTKNGHSEKSSAAPNAPFSQSLSHIIIIIYI